MKQCKAPVLLITTLMLLSTMSIMSNMLEVKAATGTFNIIASPVSQAVDNTLNQFAYYSIEIQSIAGFTGTVNLTATITDTAVPNPPGPATMPALSFPIGASVIIGPAALASYTYLFATVGGGVNPGVYTITVNGTSGIISTTATATLIVINRISFSYPDFKLRSLKQAVRFLACQKHPLNRGLSM